MQLQQSVAATVVGRGYLAADHLSTATGLDPAITISKNGGNFGNPAAGASVMTEIESTGWYKFALGTGDTDTLGPLIIRGTHATMDNIEVVFQVVAASTAQTGDSYARLGAPVALDGGAATIAAMLAKLADDNGGGSYDATTDSQRSIAADVTATHTHAAGAETQATTAAARLGAWTGTLRNTVLGAFQALFRSDADATVPSDVNADLGAGVGTAVNTTDSTQAIRDRGDAAWVTGAAAPAMITSQEVRDAMKLAPTAGVPAAGSVDQHLDDAMLAASYTAPDNTNIGNIKTVTDKLDTALEVDGLVYRYTTNALEQGPTGSGLTAQQTRDAMKLAPTAGAPAAGSVDEHLDNIPLCPCVSAVDIDNQLSGVHGAGLWGSSAGVSSVVYTACISGLPTSGIYCRLTADVVGLVTIDAGTSDALGHVTFHHSLASGTPVWVWRSKVGYAFVDPDPEVIP